ncbi:MAG: hypothetical protein HKP14_00480 [Bacteroidia bacterium]|nr:hypothetical protein [Bacteroidia bacterium]
MRFLFVYNKKAGKRFEPSIVEQISTSMPSEAEFEFVDIREFESTNDLTSYDVYVAIGGDGTVNYVASKCYEYNKVLAVIPKGSGDGLARFLGISRNIQQALSVVLNGNKIEIDVAFVSDLFFINVAGTGFEAKVAHKFGAEGIRGLWGYIRTIKQIFKKHEEREVSLTVDGHKKKITYFSLSIANGSQWGNNFEIASKADIQDGLLDVAVMRKPKLSQIPALIAYLKNKQQKSSQLFEYYKAAEIDIKKSGKKWHIDGEPIILKNKKSIRVEEKGIKIIVP